MTGRREQHVLEAPEHVRTDGVALITREQHAHGSLAVEHVEVIHPEVDEYFLELMVRIDRAIQLVLDELEVHELLRLGGSHGFAAQLRQLDERPRG
jgi:hypothetical protein